MANDDARLAYLRGCELEDAGDLEGARAHFLRAHEADPSGFDAAFALGVVCKRLLRFEESLEFSERALAIDASHEGAEWNIGIAATALGRHRRARRAWQRFLPSVDADSDAPLVMELGSVPIRLDPNGTGEVVWTRRTNPAVAIVDSIPFDDSGYGFGDVVLHDGEPRGQRMLRGESVPVFDVLTCLTRSKRSTYLAHLPRPSADDVALLSRLARERDVPIEDWTTSVRMICRACSLGEPHAEHDDGRVADHEEHMLALAAEDDEVVGELLDAYAERIGLPEIEVEVLLDRREEGA